MEVRIVRKKEQQGIATILILIFLALALTAAVLGTLKMVSSTQVQSVALHSATQSQAKSWTGVEVIHQYFQAIAEAGSLTTLTNNLQGDLSTTPIAIPITGVNNLTASIVDYDDVNQRITVNVTGVSAPGTKATATSTVQVIYAIGEGSGGTSGQEGLPNVITFNRNLRLGGSIIVETPAGEDYVINVNGDVNTNGNSITGVHTINSTGSIEIGSGSSFDQLHANGDIKLTGSVSGEQNLAALGNICLSGGASANGTVQANGTVIGDGGVHFGDISAIGHSDNAGTQLCGVLVNDTHGNPYGVDLRGNSSADSVTTSASVQLNSGSIGTLRAQKDFKITNWGGRANGQIGGVFTDVDANHSDSSISIMPGMTVPLSPLSAMAIDVDRFNAYAFESSANYAFHYVGGNMVVTVKNISGIPNGSYYVADNTSVVGPKKDRLCTNVSCTGTSYPFCKGYSDYNDCFSYSNGTWTIAGVSMSPGVAWFEGNITLSNGTYYNTFIATGNIVTSGSHVTYAPNYAGYGGVNGSNGICSNAVYPYYPSQLCNTDGTYNSDASGGLGNFAYLAGSYPAEDAPYVGGNITLGSSTVAYGSVLAGNEFVSGGSTTIYGYITAQAQGAVANNSMGGSTRIIVRNLPTSYVPMGSITLEGPGSGSTPSVSILWTQYL